MIENNQCPHCKTEGCLDFNAWHDMGCSNCGYKLTVKEEYAAQGNVLISREEQEENFKKHDR